MLQCAYGRPPSIDSLGAATAQEIIVRNHAATTHVAKPRNITGDTDPPEFRDRKTTKVSTNHRTTYLRDGPAATLAIRWDCGGGRHVHTNRKPAGGFGRLRSTRTRHRRRPADGALTDHRMGAGGARQDPAPLRRRPGLHPLPTRRALPPNTPRAPA